MNTDNGPPKPTASAAGEGRPAPEPDMPIVSSTVGLLLLAAFAPVMAASVTAASPGQVDAYTLVGATMATFLSMAYLWLQAPQLVRRANIIFTFCASITVGTLLPAPLVWWMVRAGWLHNDTVNAFPGKLWGLIALGCGLSGSTLVLVVIRWARTRIPEFLLSDRQPPSKTP